MDTPPVITASVIFKNFFREFFSNKWFYVCIGSAAIGNSIYSLDTYVVSHIVDNLRLFLDGKATIEMVFGLFYWLIALGFASWMFTRITEYAGALSQVQIAQKVYAHAFSYIHHHSYQYFTDNFAGSLFKRISRYVRSFEDLSEIIAYRIFPLVMHLIVTIIFIFFFSPFIGGIVILYVIIFCVMSFFFVRWQHPLVDRFDRLDSAFSGYITDTISNHSTILSFGRFRTEFAEFKKKSATTYDALLKMWKRGNLTSAVLAILAYSSYWIITGYALYLATQGQIVFATFIIINTYNGILTDKIWDFSSIFRSVGKIVADAREGIEILSVSHEIKDTKNASVLHAAGGDICFRDVRFGYNEDTIFDKLSLEIKSGEKVGIVGVSGSGKSTLIKLLMRLYDIDHGSITIDGYDIAKVTQESLHRSIALVPQDPILFHRSLGENIRYAQPDIDTEKLKKYCHIARCDTFIEKLPKQYDTPVGERGIKLSGGERQRVAIARALVAETPIIIFDEATSALDSESEKYIQEAMFDAIEGKTAIVIAHRLSTLVHLDRILVFDSGKIIENGTHKELIKKGGTYAKLWTIQSGEFRE